MIATLVCLPLCIFLIAFYIWLKHREKMTMIEKGEIIRDDNFLENSKYSILSKAILLISMSIGLAIAYIINSNLHNQNGIVILTIYAICLLGAAGIGLLAYYFIIKNK